MHQHATPGAECIARGCECDLVEIDLFGVQSFIFPRGGIHYVVGHREQMEVGEPCTRYVMAACTVGRPVVTIVERDHCRPIEKPNNICARCVRWKVRARVQTNDARKQLPLRGVA
jgi:hypothetical protein